MVVSAIIVTFNPDISLLKKQYKSLENQVDNIIYIDNGSENLKEIDVFLSNLENPFLHIKSNLENRGLGYAHNQGIQLAKTLSSDAVLILDHDSVLNDDFVENLKKNYDYIENKCIKIAAIGPVYINKETGEQYPITRYIGPFIKRLKPMENPVEASTLISSGTLIPMRILEEVGYMDEKLFVDYIDIEWSYRARSKGYKLFATPQAVMNHKIGDKRISVFGRMISVHSPLRRYYLSRNSIYMLRLSYVSWGYKIRELIFNILRIIVFTAISNQRFKYLKYSFVGVYDGLVGKFGKCSLI